MVAAGSRPQPLMEAKLLELDRPAQLIEPQAQPQLGLAVALMRRGMDEVVRMACELGIDRIQPLRCDRCVPQADHRPERWATIIREAVEQCERLWTPQLLDLKDLSQWMADERGQRLVGVTRETAPPALDQWLRHQADSVSAHMAHGRTGRGLDRRGTETVHPSPDSTCPDGINHPAQFHGRCGWCRGTGSLA